MLQTNRLKETGKIKLIFKKKKKLLIFDGFFFHLQFCLYLSKIIFGTLRCILFVHTRLKFSDSDNGKEVRVTVNLHTTRKIQRKLKPRLALLGILSEYILKSCHFFSLFLSACAYLS